MCVIVQKGNSSESVAISNVSVPSKNAEENQKELKQLEKNP